MNNSNSGFIGGPVNTLNRKDVPPINETISDDMDIEAAARAFSAITVYFRDKDSCPLNRGNWIIDLFAGFNRIIPAFCMKLPASMKEEEVNRWVKPLMDKIKNRDN